MTGMEIGKSLLEQLADLVERDPQNNDVIFSVGPDKIKVSGVKIILKAASPVFEMGFFEDRQGIAVLKDEGEGIPFPDIDPSLFKLFVKLTMSDAWSVDALNELNVPPATMLSLLGLCRRFKITKAISNLEEAAHGFIRDFADFKDTQEFLEMSQENLETVFSCEQIPLNEMEIFECALGWAKHQCKAKKIELTCKNFREVLGSCFFEIRFATMKIMEFIKLSNSKKNMFTRREVVAICGLITTDDEGERVEYEKEGIPIKTNPRSSFGCSVLRLPKQFEISSEYSFECDGSRSENWFQVNKKISLHGIGFLGPIDGDTEYDVRVRIKTFNSFCVFDSRPLTKSILARRGRIFHFFFDEPIPIEPHTFSDYWWNGNCISYRLKGASNIPVYTRSDKTDLMAILEETVQVSSRIEFYLDEQWSMSPLAEFLFK